MVIQLTRIRVNSVLFRWLLRSMFLGVLIISESVVSDDFFRPIEVDAFLSNDVVKKQYLKFTIANNLDHKIKINMDSISSSFGNLILKVCDLKTCEELSRRYPENAYLGLHWDIGPGETITPEYAQIHLDSVFEGYSKLVKSEAALIFWYLSLEGRHFNLKPDKYNDVLEFGGWITIRPTFN